MALWTPALLADSDLALWLDADDAGTITESGGSLSAWDDKSGNGNDFDQTTASEQPATGATTLNGKNVIDFDGDWLETVSGTQITGVRSAIFVTTGVNGSDTSTTVAPIFGDNILDEDHTFIRTNIGDYSISIDGTDGKSGNASVDGALSPTSGANINLGLSNAEKEGGRLWYIDWDTGNDYQTIGRLATGNIRELIGSIGEVIWLSYVPTESERQIIEGYLAHKWVLEANLPAGHPYKSSAPSVDVLDWTPEELGTEVAAWYDAADPSVITEASDNVSLWTDKSGNALNLSQGLGSLQPTTNASRLNFKNVIDFASDHMAAGDFLPSLSSDFTVVYIGTTVIGYGLDGAPTPPSGGWGFQVNDRTSVVYTSPSLVGVSSPVPSGRALSDTSIRVGYFDQGSEVGMYYDGSDSDFTAPAAGSVLRNDTDKIQVGRDGSNTGYETGFIAEILLFNRLITTDERKKIEGYLAHKWSLTNLLPPAHPYKTTSPKKSIVAPPQSILLSLKNRIQLVY